jgi:hydroxyacylglutathione hydrolase
MPQEIRTINLGGVNCYLLEGSGGYLLADTGFLNRRVTLDKKLADGGCRPGNLNLIVLTHGDEDHAGNAAYLRENYGARIAMHPADSPMVEQGDMQWGRKAHPDRYSPVFKITSVVSTLFIKSGKFETFKPDVSVEDGLDLAVYGFDARIINTPGHSKGSISVLTGGGVP